MDTRQMGQRASRCDTRVAQTLHMHMWAHGRVTQSIGLLMQIVHAVSTATVDVFCVRRAASKE